MEFVIDALFEEHSQKVAHAIAQLIEQKGPLSFFEFMQLALYAPDLGYYVAGCRKLGEAGDFITAPELSPLFSQCVAMQCQQILSEISSPSILELGAGSGIMALEILRALAAQNNLPEHYYILEVSPDLRERQETLFKNSGEHWTDRVMWIDQWPSHFRGVILANEVLDAMPVHRFKKTSSGYREFYVDYQQKNFCWQLGACTTELQHYLAQLNVTLPPSYVSEANTLLSGWIKGLSICLEKGVALLIDYGFPRAEFYHPQRNQGTLMCHFKHRAHDNPLVCVGMQDITAHVDFTAVVESAVKNNVDIAGFTHQANFLINCGLISLFNASADKIVNYQQAQIVKRLTLPSEMGELFKVMALSKNYDAPLIGFQTGDQMHRL